jgi:hypothetical protein
MSTLTTLPELQKPYGIISDPRAVTTSSRDLQSFSKVFYPLVQSVSFALGGIRESYNSAWGNGKVPDLDTMADAEKRMTKALHQTYKAYNKLNEETKYSPILEASSDDAKDLKKLHDGILSAYESAQMWTKTLENCQTRRGLLKIVSDPGMDSYTKVQEVLGFASEISQRR